MRNTRAMVNFSKELINFSTLPSSRIFILTFIQNFFDFDEAAFGFGDGFNQRRGVKRFFRFFINPKIVYARNMTLLDETGNFNFLQFVYVAQNAFQIFGQFFLLFGFQLNPGELGHFFNVFGFNHGLDYSIFKNSFSSIIFTPSFLAFSYFEPGSSPATTKSVSRETDSEAFPPKARTLDLASSLDIEDKLPVRTKVLPFSLPAGFFAGFFISTCFKSLPRNSAFLSSPNQP